MLVKRAGPQAVDVAEVFIAWVASPGRHDGVAKS